MSHTTLMTNVATARAPRTARRALFKRDHPRAVDEYINYFGGALGEFTVADPGGEPFLDGLGREEVRTARRA
jgi:hypothetical protein